MTRPIRDTAFVVGQSTESHEELNLTSLARGPFTPVYI
jgi:hypothetical protein